MNAKEFNKHLNNITNDTNSLDAIFNYYYCRIVFHLQSKYGYETAEEAAQEFFLYLMRYKGKFDYIEFPILWVYKCSENFAKMLIRKKCSTIPLSDSEKYEYIPKEELYGDIYKYLKLLDEISYQIIVLVYWDGYNLKEVSKILNINYDTIRQKYRRALKKLNKMIRSEM